MAEAPAARLQAGSFRRSGRKIGARGCPRQVGREIAVAVGVKLIRSTLLVAALAAVPALAVGGPLEQLEQYPVSPRHPHLPVAGATLDDELPFQQWDIRRDTPMPPLPPPTGGDLSEASPVPEPASLTMLAAGLFGAAVALRRRRHLG